MCAYKNKSIKIIIMLEPFAKAAWLLEEEKRAISTNHSYLENSKNVTSYIDHLIDRCIRTASNLIIPNASKNALILAKRLHIDLFAAKEGDKVKIKNFCLANNESDYFYYEHKETVSELRKRISICTSLQEVLFVFNSIEVVWVLNSENMRLVSNGHNSKRSDSNYAYTLAGIEIQLSSYLDYQLWKKSKWKA